MNPFSTCRAPRRLVRGLLLASAMLPFQASPALAQPTPVGEDFQVNSYTTGFQGFQRIDMNASGDFVVVWEGYVNSPGTDSDAETVIARRFASNGSAIGEDFQVNTYTTDAQQGVDIAISDDGTFAVVWRGPTAASDFAEVLAQRYASDGTALGGEFVVNAYTTSFQFEPAIASLENGRFVVTWSSGQSPGTDNSVDSVQAQLFAADGSFIGDQFQLNTYTTLSQGDPAVSGRPDGGFVAVWDSNGSSELDTDSQSIQGQIFDADGAPVGAQFEVNTYTSGLQRAAAVDTDGEGGFIVVWRSPGSSGSDSDDRSVLGQRFSSSGDPVGGEIQINTYTTGPQQEPGV